MSEILELSFNLDLSLEDIHAFISKFDEFKHLEELEKSLQSETLERRKELVKTVKKITEECKVSMRKTRREALDQLHLLDKEISKDDIKRTEEKIQKTLNDFEAKVDAIVDKKETELLTI